MSERFSKITHLPVRTEHDPLQNVPLRFRDGMRLYVDRGIKPGRFLRAVIANDLRHAAVRASDSHSLYAIKPIVQYLENHAPPECWGGWSRFHAWVFKGGKDGR